MNIHTASKVSLLLSLSVTTFCVAETTQLSNGEVSQLTPVQQLGKHIFFDKNLSSPVGQSCASCHDPKAAFSEPDLNTPVSNGAVEGRTGTRNTPLISYTAFSPVFHFDNEESLYFGGQFLDGRAANLTEQAKKPFLNVDEMNNRDEAEVVDKLRLAAYANLFKQVYGLDVLNNTSQAFQAIAEALAAFESTPVFNRFSSKYDYFLAGQVELTEQESKGLELFNDANKGNCAACHPSSSDSKQPPLFTDFSYDNLGTPKNPEILAKKGQDFVDLGLGAIVNNVNENGKFKVPTLRNIAKTAPYMHNGVFQT
ncbi:MAG: cytochrome c peroxidase, partial [Methylobacter sp.]|nr:cytochrome c peroxidase [Methylobacter sp.]